MTSRVVIGSRANGDVGVFVSPPGVDALTAADSALRLGISSKISQLVALGVLSGSATLALGFTRPPLVFVTSRATLSALPDMGGLDGPARPSPIGISGAYTNLTDPSTATINSNGASVTFSLGSAAFYAIYNETF